jgi:hypothetical protein
MLYMSKMGERDKRGEAHAAGCLVIRRKLYGKRDSVTRACAALEAECRASGEVQPCWQCRPPPASGPQRSRSRQSLAGAPIGPRAQGFQDRAERLAISRERVDARNRGSWVDLPVDQSSILQFPETVRHHAIGKAGDGTFQFIEASWPLQQEKQNLERPPLGQHLELACEVLRQFKRDIGSTNRLASHGRRASLSAHFSYLTNYGKVITAGVVSASDHERGTVRQSRWIRRRRQAFARDDSTVTPLACRGLASLPGHPSISVYIPPHATTVLRQEVP